MRNWIRMSEGTPPTRSELHGARRWSAPERASSPCTGDDEARGLTATVRLMSESLRAQGARLLMVAALALTAACSSLQTGSKEFTPTQAHADAESVVISLVEAATGQQPDVAALETLAKPRACLGVLGTDDDTAFFMGHFTGEVPTGSADSVYAAAVAHLESSQAPEFVSVSASTDLERTVVFTLETLEGYFLVEDSSWVLSLETRCAQKRAQGE